jgi:hypothetical protein
VPQGVEVQVLSHPPTGTQPGRLAQLARASRLHREGRGFESLSAHQCGSLAQLVEQRPEEPCVPSSSLGGATNAGVAQLFRARPCQGRGQGLESPHPHQYDT